MRFWPLSTLPRVSLGVAMALIMGASAVQAVQPEPDVQALEIPLPEYAADLAPTHVTARAAAQRATAELEGVWQVYRWDRAADTPAWIYGTGLDLPGSAGADDAALESIARQFIDSHPGIFKAVDTDLVLDTIARGAGKVGVHFMQTYAGVPVVGARVSLVLTDSGRLAAFGSEFHSTIELDPAPALTATAASRAAQNALPFNPAVDRIEGAPELVVVPVPRFEGGATYRLAWQVRVTTTEPYGIWRSYVDAATGQIFWRENEVEQLYSGASTGDVERPGYCDGVTPDSPFRKMTINVSGAGSSVTDADGNFSIPGSAGSQTVTAAFDGPEANINNQDGPDASFSSPIQPDVPFSMLWTDANSHPAERDVFFFVNETDAYLKTVDPTWDYAKYTVNVNVNAACNANWSGTTMNFFRELGGCGNTGRIGDVVAHEFGHGVQFSLLGDQGNEGLGEGNGDIMGTLMSDDSVIGRGFNLNVCSSGIRNCENTLVYPTHVVGQPIHSAGRVICGFNWDMWQALTASLGPEAGKAKTAELWHFARKVFRPDVQPDQVLAYFVIDDDDANLLNGTPHYSEICEGATNHGFPCPDTVPVYVAHTPLADTQDTQNPYPVVATIIAYDGALEPDSLRVYYRSNLGAFGSSLMTATGNPDEFAGSIPAQPLGTLVQYYIAAANDLGERVTNPDGAPTVLLSFFVGTPGVAAVADMETDPGWTVGPNTATGGIWERADPVQVIVYVQGNPNFAQPPDDHTPDPGVLCWITENGVPGQLGGATDVDNGYTTLATATYNLAGEPFARLSFYLFYTNHLGGNPGEDAFDVDVSTNGGSTWVNMISRLGHTNNDWEKVQLDITNYVPLTSTMKFRFVARDLGGASLVEAAIDDFLIEVLPQTQGVAQEAGASPLRYAIAQNRPNPFNPSTEIRFTAAAEAPVSLRVYDVEGRVVRTLVDGVMPAGEHVAVWDGRDGNGAAAASGIYYYKIEAGDFMATRKMVLVK